MNIREQEDFIYSLNEDKATFQLVSIDWETHSMNCLSCYENTDEDMGNTTVAKLYFDENYEVQFKTNGYVRDISKIEFYQNLEWLKSLPSFHENLDLIIEEFKKT
jgi:hypothetical protein